MALVALVAIRAATRREADSNSPPSAAANDQPLSGEQVYQRLIRCSALIMPRTGTGSGFVVSTEKRLVMTNYHVVGRDENVVVVFPLYDATGEPITDPRRYGPKVKEVAVRGEVVARDEGRDLALIRVERLPDRVSAVPFARRPVATGAAVYSVGSSGADNNLLWRLTKGSVRGRVERRVPLSSGGVLNCMILETDAPINPGDSGGPVANDRGELIGVVSHFMTRERQVSGNIDIDEVRKFAGGHLSSP